MRILLAVLVAGAAAGPALLGAAPPPPCVADGVTLCVDDLPGDQRYQLRVTYQTVQGGGLAGSGHAVSLAAAGFTRAGAFWFFSPDNPEMLVKLLDGCALNQHHWLLAAATTNVGYSLAVTDTLTGVEKTYTSADQTAAVPIQDAAAFDCADPCTDASLATHIDAFSATASLAAGSPQTFSWTLGGAGPFSQSLTGTELANVALGAADRGYTFAPQAPGPHTATLAVKGRCGSDARTVSYDVQQSCAMPHIDSFTTNYPNGSSVFCTGDTATLSWQTSGSGDVTISPSVGSVGPSGSVNVTANAPTTYTITKTATCGTDSAMLNLQVTQPASIQYLTVDEPIACGTQTTFRFDVEGDGIQWWMFTETTFNSFGGQGSGPQTHGYTPTLQACGNSFVAILQAQGTCLHTDIRRVTVTVGPCAPGQCG
ncbi:MAG TPA: hypothetical protein VJA16_19820 [Thermoanaerobaculia bacterium]